MMTEKAGKEGKIIDEEIKAGVRELRKDSPAAAYKAERNLEREEEILNNKPSDLPSDSDR